MIDLILCLFPPAYESVSQSRVPVTLERKRMSSVLSLPVTWFWEFFKNTSPHWCQRSVCVKSGKTHWWNAVCGMEFVHFCFVFHWFYLLRIILFIENVLEAPQILWIVIYININIYIYIYAEIYIRIDLHWPGLCSCWGVFQLDVCISGCFLCKSDVWLY